MKDYIFHPLIGNFKMSSFNPVLLFGKGVEKKYILFPEHES